MTKATIAGGAFATVVALLAIAAGYRAFKQEPHPRRGDIARDHALDPVGGGRDARGGGDPTGGSSTAGSRPPTAPPTRGGCAGVRAATRRRSGATTSTALSTRTPGSPKCRRSCGPRSASTFEIFGIKIAERERAVEVRRQLVARFGEIARIEARGASRCG